LGGRRKSDASGSLRRERKKKKTLGKIFVNALRSRRRGSRIKIYRTDRPGKKKGKPEWELQDELPEFAIIRKSSTKDLFKKESGTDR